MRLRRQIERIAAEPSEDEVWRAVELARHQDRPYTLDYVERILDDFVELRGDRCNGDDQAIVAGLGRFRGETVVVVGHQKGRDIHERTRRNFGMASPEGYRKAIRVMEIGARHGFPVLSLVDTPGAYPGVAAEQHGQGGWIARSQLAMARLPVPSVACVIGEGGSGGAVAIAVADRVLMQENAIYSVISPEGCAAILWRDASEAKKAAAAFKPDARHCLELGVIDRIVAEPPGGAHDDHSAAADLLAEGLSEALDEVRVSAPTSVSAPGGRSSAPWASMLPERQQSTRSTGFSPHLLGKGEDPTSRSRRSVRTGPQAGSLADYDRKRDPARTPEPAGARAGSAEGGKPIFVVQRHAARGLHYDLRLERHGALASWAVPKGIPTDPGSRRLAVRVEEHPLAYADFEGEIPAGEYGAGAVEIWDRGTYELLEEKADGGLTVRLQGRRLAGRWALVPARLDGDERNWLLVRKRDTDAPEARSYPRHAPMLATLADSLPPGDEWLFEVKWDGYRVLARLRDGEAALWSRTGKDLTGRFAAVAQALPRAVRSAGLRARRRGLRPRRVGTAQVRSPPVGPGAHWPIRCSTCSSSRATRWSSFR